MRVAFIVAMMTATLPFTVRAEDKIDFVHAKSGYHVTGERSATGNMHLVGNNPQTGSKFQAEVSTSGVVDGILDGEKFKFTSSY